MNDRELQALEHTAAGKLLFHRGWGPAAGYRWCGPDGTEAGAVPHWESDALDHLAGCGLIAIEPRLGPADCRVRLTPTGATALHGLPLAA